jgi:hypothetical protein
MQDGFTRKWGSKRLKRKSRESKQMNIQLKIIRIKDYYTKMEPRDAWLMVCENISGA